MVVFGTKHQADAAGFIGQRQASISFLQRRMRLGYPKAARFIDMMEQDRVIGPGDGAKPREVLVGPEYLAKRGK